MTDDNDRDEDVLEALDFEPSYDTDQIHELLDVVLNALPDTEKTRWHARFATDSRVDMRPDRTGWVWMIHGGECFCRIHRDTFIEGNDVGRAIVTVDGKDHEMELTIPSGADT